MPFVLPRCDARDSAYANHVVMLVRSAKRHETASRRRKVPSQAYPHALEAEYGTKLVALVGRLRAVYATLAKEMPKLLARAQESRGDSADVVDMRAAISPDNQVVKFAGFDVAVENAVGSYRAWVDSNGESGKTLMRFAYGYIVGAMGVDGDEVDVYMGPEQNAKWVYVVHQNVGGEYDEDKVMLGFPSADAAERAYLGQYDDPSFFGGMTQMLVEDFRAFLAKNDGRQIAHGRMDSGELEFARRIIDQASQDLKRQLTASEISRITTFFARETSQAQRRQLARQLKAGLGIDILPDERYVPQVMDYFAHENATLISSVSEDMHHDIANLTARAFTKRMDPDTFAKLLEEQFALTESRARFIARDQLGKLWGQLNAVRQRGVGVTHFFWETRKDNLVRKTHRALEGMRISYDEPPSFGLPGEDFGCRCGARPDLSAILADASKTSLRAGGGGHDVPLP